MLFNECSLQNAHRQHLTEGLLAPLPPHLSPSHTPGPSAWVLPLLPPPKSSPLHSRCELASLETLPGPLLPTPVELAQTVLPCPARATTRNDTSHLGNQRLDHRLREIKWGFYSPVPPAGSTPLITGAPKASITLMMKDFHSPAIPTALLSQHAHAHACTHTHPRYCSWPSLSPSKAKFQRHP